MGTPLFAVSILKTLYQNGYEIPVVYTQPPQKSQRGQKVNKSPIQGISETLSIELRTPLSAAKLAMQSQALGQIDLQKLQEVIKRRLEEISLRVPKAIAPSVQSELTIDDEWPDECDHDGTYNLNEPNYSTAQEGDQHHARIDEQPNPPNHPHNL